MKNNNSLTKYQVKELQADVESLKADMRKIMENELPHLKEQINGLSTQVKEQIDGISGQVKLVGAVNILAILAVIALTQLLV